MKFSEIRHLEKKELWLKVASLKKKLFLTRIQLSQTRKVSNPLKIRFLRRDIARLNTALSLLKIKNSASVSKNKGPLKKGVNQSEKEKHKVEKK